MEFVANSLLPNEISSHVRADFHGANLGRAKTRRFVRQNCQPANASANRGKLSIALKRKASSHVGRSKEKLCTSCGWNIEKRFSAMSLDLRDFRCSLSCSTRGRNFRSRFIRRKRSPPNSVANQKQNSGTWPRPSRGQRFLSG